MPHTSGRYAPIHDLPFPCAFLKRILGNLAALSLLLQPVLAFAGLFPDVPDDYIYRKQIENLANVQVISGNPDGTFTPEAPVNRAAMLKMLYKASGIKPDIAYAGCFPDVQPGAWYEPFVCYAAANRYVQGYSDGTFRPSNNVNRAEAIKMITLMFAIQVPELTNINREVLKFVDISTSAWYTKYLSAAFMKGILPIVGQGGPRFYPDWPLLRGEAAAYIYNALNVQLEEIREEEESQSSSSVDATETSVSSVAASSQSQSSPKPQATLIETAFPFSRTGTFQEKASAAYGFTLQSAATIDITASIAKGGAGKISCRLYRLTEAGFSDEYYLGLEENQSCYLLVSLQPGTYQLQLTPTTPNVSYSVSAKTGVGDGNDGFSQARGIIRGNLRTEVLSANDYQDWFKFTLSRETLLTLKVVASANLRCTIYPSAAVDLFGFTGPECGTEYLYPAGTYIVGIGHTPPRATKQTYTIQLK